MPITEAVAPNQGYLGFTTIFAGDSPYTPPVGPFALIVFVDPSGGQVDLVLPDNPPVGTVFTITDVGGTVASNHNITVTATKGIDGLLTLYYFDPLIPPGIFTPQFKSYTLFFLGDSGYRIVWSYFGFSIGAPPLDVKDQYNATTSYTPISAAAARF